MKPFYRSCWLMVRGIFKLFYGLRVTKPEQTPSGGAIIAPNHLSHLDPPLVGIAYPEEIHFLARDTLFTKKLGWLLRKLNAHPINREGADISSLKMILRLLKEGKKVMIFPEGTRSRTGDLGEAQAGVAMLSLRSGCPIVPVRVSGTDTIMPPGASRPKWRGKVHVSIGEPIDPNQFSDLEKREAQSALTQTVMEEIAGL
jgi:1-acyl-sn-glycerol-3-phosphate acyltransferase